MTWKFQVAIVSCVMLGLRHGFDYDHLAALTDITAVQTTWKNGMRLGLRYATGHALTIVGLGTFVIVIRGSLPRGLDVWATRLTGATLVVLSVAVFMSLISKRSLEFAYRGRWTMVIEGTRHLWKRVRYRSGAETLPRESLSWVYTDKSVIGIGMLHGLGAETPTQLMLFLLAASLGGTWKGFLGLLCFAFGLIVMNALMTAALGGAFRATESRDTLRRWVATSGAFYSLVVGLLFLLSPA